MKVYIVGQIVPGEKKGQLQVKLTPFPDKESAELAIQWQILLYGNAYYRVTPIEMDPAELAIRN